MADPARETPDTTMDTTEGPETVNTETVNTEVLNTDARSTGTPHAATPDAGTSDAATERTAREDTEPVTVATPLRSTAAGTPHPDLAFSGYTGASGVDPAPIARRRGPDPLALLVGLATLAMAVFAFVGELPDLSGVDPRWLLAGGAALVGLVLLVGSLRGRSGRRS